MTIRDVLTQAEGNIGAVPNIPTPVKSYNLNDLRENDEFNTVTERFLKSLGEGENADDLFEYFRGADFNLKDGFDVYRQSKQFTNQQKQDYLYLRNKFDNAEVGGLWEWVKTSADVGSEMLSDPTIIASALLVPWTGGTSAAARIAAGKATQLGLKKLASKEIAEGIAKGVAKLPGQKLKSPLTKVQTSAILGAEGSLYGGTYDYIGQQTQIETDQREKYDPSQTAKVAAITGTIGAAIPPIGRYAAKKIKKIPEFNRSLQERRLERIDNAENYKADTIDLITDKVNKALFFIQKPTSRFIVKAKRSETLSKIIKMFRYDAEQGLVAGKLGTQKRLDFSYSENLYELLGLRTDRLTEILKPLKSRGSVQVPSLGSRDSFFKIPFTKGKEKFKQSFFHRFRVDPELNDQLVYYLRSGETSRDGVKFNSKVITAGKKIRKLLNDIHTHAEKVGLKPGRVENFFPRKWLISMLEADPKQFRKALIQKEGLSETEADSLIKRLLSPEEAEARSSINIASRTASLKAPRKLTKLDDFELSKYLDNDVENVLSDYLHSTSSLIVRKEMFGETFGEFKKRYINKIQKELGQNRLTKGELKHLENLYLFTTGQKGFIHNKLGRAVSDTFTVMNQLSLLPLATITSFSEIGVPIVRGGKVDSKSVMSLRDSFVTVSKDWWNNIVKKDIDVRSASLKELNALNRAMTIAREDRAMAIFGQAHGHRGTKLQNHFFKLNFLHHWTKFVQLTSYEVGKTKIYTNLSTLANPKGASKKTLKRLTDELNELGVDVDKGIKWINNGAKSSSAFYKNNVTKSAARYVDEVIMNPTQAAAQKPLMHQSPYTKWAFGLLGFPTAFSNTVLRNAARDLTKDARNLSAHSSVNALTGTSVMILSAVAGNTLRTGGENFREVAKGEKDIVGSVKLRDKENTSILYDAVIRAGIFGPFEYGERIDDTNKFKNKILASITTLTGPATSDIISFIVQGRITETAFNNLPLATLLQKLHPEKYKEVQKYFREIDKETFGSDPYKAPAVPFSIGGEVVGQRQRNFKGGEISEDYPVTDVAKNPADRDLDNLPLSFNEVASNEPINPFTGEPYTALYYNGGAVRKQYNEGGLNLFKNIAKRIKESVPASARLYFDKVIKQDKNPISKKDFTEKEYNEIKQHVRNTLKDDLKANRVKFNNKGELEFRRKTKEGDIATKPVISGYTKYGDGRVPSFTNVFGDASYSLTKDSYKNSKVSINDVYDFNHEYGGGYNPDWGERPGFLNQRNRKTYTELAKYVNPLEVIQGNFRSLRPLAERYGAFQLPDEETAVMLQEKYSPVNVKVDVPISEMFTEEEWKDLTLNNMERLGFATGSIGYKDPNYEVPRAIRNNNPYNLIYGPSIGVNEIMWDGKLEHDPNIENTFERFETPLMGMRAGLVNTLTHYQKYGRNTIRSLISAHAPQRGDIKEYKGKDENPTESFISFVADKMGVSDTDVLNLHNRETLRAYNNALIEFEGFTNADEALVNEALDLAYSYKNISST